jgi:hypothetical protein
MNFCHLILSIFFTLYSLHAGGSEIEANISLAPGYRCDEISWSVSSAPLAEVLTTEKWTNLKIFQLGAAADFRICKCYYLEATASYGWMGHGNKSFDETTPFSESDGWLRAKTRGHVYDFSGALGYSFPLCDDHLDLTPCMGYSYHVQKLHDRNYTDIIHMLNLFTDVKSAYTYRWQGPWLGFSSQYLFDCGIQAFIKYQYHWLIFHGAVHDHLVNDVKENLKNNHVHCNEATLAFFSPQYYCFSLGIIGNYKLSLGRNGTSRIENASYSMKRLTWRSKSLSLNLQGSF